ncbi:MAG TPA: Rieske 2Fe-2S domain-containing protein [Candidatus Binatia bacterium]|jgi:phenylpropionate dioxygenase-like ring-hydroxylating dioxygenase large terminal subunit
MKAGSAFRAGREGLHHFTKQENEALTRVGPGALMGNLFRQYWIPVTPAADMREPGGRPLRVKLLGEDLVLFRCAKGELGLIGSFCPHRLAPLFYGRVEADGLRCAYHGWKFAPDGKCIEMPNIPTEIAFSDEIHHPAYPCVEHGGIIWTYMGQSRTVPELPDLEFLRVDEGDRQYRLFFQECNYLQVLEGGIDPTHVMWLHSPYDLADEELSATQQPDQHRVAQRSGARTPLDVAIAETAGGFTYGAKRSLGNGKALWRINQFIMPFYTMPPGGDQKQARAYVPVDDENCVKWQIKWFPSKNIKENSKETLRGGFAEEAYEPATNSIPFGHVRTKANKRNDYLMNWELHKDRRFGVVGVNLQDVSITENEGPTPILDRTKENLCAGDMTVIKARLLLLEAARAFRERSEPAPGARDPGVYRVRGCAVTIPDDIDWIEGARETMTVPEK